MIPTFRALLCAALAANTAWAQVHETKPAATVLEPSPAHAPKPLPTASARATDPIPAVVPAPTLPGVLWGERDGVLWARTPNYKASFDGARFTFAPFLGADAPKNEPVGFALALVRVAGRELAAQRPLVRRDGDRVDVERGAFVERYDVAEHGVEQSFRFEALPERGALELDLAVDTELEHGADQLGHVFTCTRGGVRYGVAKAIDARGRTLALETTWTGSALHVAVPAAFVQQAALPLVVDPLVTNLTIDDASWDAVSPDLAFDAPTTKWAAVFETVFSASDHDVFVRCFHDDGSLESYAVVDASSTNYAAPRIASCGAASQFLVVATAGIAPSRTIRAVRMDAWTNQVLSDVRLDTAAGDKLDPDVGGDPSSSAPGAFAVVWTRVYSATDRDVHGRLVDTNGTLSGATEFLLDNSGATLDERPRIANSCGTSATPMWSIVFQRAVTPTNHDVLGLGLARTGAVVYPTFAIENGAQDTTAPVVSSATDPVSGASVSFCVCEKLVGGQHDLFGDVLSGNVVVESYLIAQSSADEIEPDLDCNGRVFGLTYARERVPGAQDYGTAYTTIAYVPNVSVSTESVFPTGSNTALERAPRIAAKHSGGDASARFGFAYDRAVSAADHDVGVGLVDPNMNPPIFSYCQTGAILCPCGNSGSNLHGCGNSVNWQGAYLQGAGTSSVSQDGLVLSVSGLPATAPCLFFQGSASVAGTTFGDGVLCTGGTVIRLRTKAASAGVVSYPEAGETPLSIRGQLPQAGGTRYYQVWYRNAAAFCTSATFNASNGLTVLWMP